MLSYLIKAKSRLIVLGLVALTAAGLGVAQKVQAAPPDNAPTVVATNKDGQTFGFVKLDDVPVGQSPVMPDFVAVVRGKETIGYVSSKMFTQPCAPGASCPPTPIVNVDGKTVGYVEDGLPRLLGEPKPVRPRSFTPVPSTVAVK
jgi:hypothetical protein